MKHRDSSTKHLFLAFALTVSTFSISDITSAEVLALDNGEPGTSYNGSWKVSDGVTPYGSSSLYTSANGAAYTFKFDLTTPGEYRVLAWWSGLSNADKSEATVDFDTPTPPGSSNSLLSGVFGGIDFGQGQWRWESAWGASSSNHVFFSSVSGQSRDFQFTDSTAVLTGLSVTAGAAGILTLSDSVGQTFTRTLPAGRSVFDRNRMDAGG